MCRTVGNDGSRYGFQITGTGTGSPYQRYRQQENGLSDTDIFDGVSMSHTWILDLKRDVGRCKAKRKTKRKATQTGWQTSHVETKRGMA